MTDFEIVSIKEVEHGIKITYIYHKRTASYVVTHKNDLKNQQDTEDEMRCLMLAIEKIGLDTDATNVCLQIPDIDDLVIEEV